MKTRLRLALAAAALAAAAVGLSFSAPARADGAAEAIAAFKDYLKTNPDSQGLRNQIAELSLKKDAGVAEVLMPLLTSPKYDEEVKIAVCQAVGKQGKKEVAGTLLHLADSKPWEEKWKLIAAALEGAGDANAEGNYKELMKWAKKYLDINPDVAGAGYRAAAQHVTRDTVDDLIKELVRSDSATTADSQQKRASRGATKPVIMEILKKITGRGINDVKAWTDWWNENKKTWTPPVPGKEKPKDLNASDTYVNGDYFFELKRPSKVWTFRAGNGGAHVLTIEALDDGQRAAWIELIVEGTRNLKSKTPEAYANESRENIEPKFRDLKSAEWEKKCVFGGEKGIEQLLNGMHKEFDAIHMHNVYVEHKGLMFNFGCVFKAGKKASLETDIEDILRSLKFTN